MKIEKEFIPYEQALELKELGFDEPCFTFYWDNAVMYNTINNPHNHNITLEISAPLYQQSFSFFREKYGLKHDIDDDNDGTKFYYKIKSYTDKFDNYDDIIKFIREEKDWSKIEFKTYEEAELDCLIKLIEIVKNKKHEKYTLITNRQIK